MEDDESFFFPDDFRGVFGIVKREGGRDGRFCVVLWKKLKEG